MAANIAKPIAKNGIKTTKFVINPLHMHKEADIPGRPKAGQKNQIT